MLTTTEIHQFLKDNGIRKSDTVIVHTSMRALGAVDGGCDGLIDAFTSYLSEGLFIVPTHTWANVGAEQPVYDVRSTPPCIGALPTVAAFRKDGIRSLHPTHSVAAFGNRAKEFVKGEEICTSPCPAGGIWSRLYEEHAKILLLGVKLNRNTYIHTLDELLSIPNRLKDPIPLTVIDYDGNACVLQFRKHGHTDSEEYEKYRTALETAGAMTNARLGNAEVGIVDARGCRDVLVKLLSEQNQYGTADAKDLT